MVGSHKGRARAFIGLVALSLLLQAVGIVGQSSAAVLANPAAVLANPAAGPVKLPAAATNTPNPTSVTIAGDLQSELGCTGDWDPGCAATHLTYDAGDDVWQGTWTVPAGN